MTSALIILELMAIVSRESLFLCMRFQKYAIWVSRAAILDFSHPGKVAKMILVGICIL